MSHKTNRPLTIAIDGYSSCGKSTLAKQLARELGYIFVDSGAMYRAVTLYFLESGTNINDKDEVAQALEKIKIRFENIDGINTTFLNDKNVESEIRSLVVSSAVSEVSAIPVVRKKLVALQRQMKGREGMVMDGRDIGTVVFPDAEVKIFITADPIIRAQRRYNELISKNQTADIHEVITNLAHRDKIDTEREDSPLRQADDAWLLDNSHLTVTEQFDLVLNKVLEKDRELTSGAG